MSNPPSIKFPCPNYPIKVIGENQQQMVPAVLNIFIQRVADFPGIDAFKIKLSAKGNYQSINTSIDAESQQQLSQLHSDLLSCPGVKLVL